MPRRSTHPLQVIQSYIDYLNGLINRLVSDSRLVSVAGPSERFRNITGYQDGIRRPLRLIPSGFLFFDQLVEVVEKVGGQAVQVMSYTYIYSPSESMDDWVFRYEYDRPPSEELFDKPHAHVHLHAADERGAPYDKIHFPTGRISVEQLIAHLVYEWGVEPKLPREDAFSLLKESHAKYLTLRTDLSGGEVLFP